MCYNEYNERGTPIFEPSFRKGGDDMPVKYKIDVLAALKAAGYNTNRIRKEKTFNEGTLQNIREGKIVNGSNLSKLCELLQLQPGDILEYTSETGNNPT